MIEDYEFLTQSNINHALLGTGSFSFPTTYAANYFTTLEELYNKCAGIVAWCSSFRLGLCCIGEARWFLGFGLQTWDIAAGSLLIQGSRWHD